MLLIAQQQEQQQVAASDEQRRRQPGQITRERRRPLTQQQQQCAGTGEESGKPEKAFLSKRTAGTVDSRPRGSLAPAESRSVRRDWYFSYLFAYGTNGEKIQLEFRMFKILKIAFP